MYMTLRTVRAAPGRVGDAVALTMQGAQLINDRFGGNFSVATQVGGDPDVLAVSSPWESLGAYQAARSAYMADDELLGLIPEFGSMTLSTEDQIVHLLAPAGERADFTVMTRIRIHLPRIAEAIPLGLEICEFVEDRVGLKVGFATAFTGDRSGAGWFVRYDSLDHLASTTETLEADPEYLEFFKRAGDLFVDGSADVSIWQRLM